MPGSSTVSIHKGHHHGGPCCFRVRRRVRRHLRLLAAGLLAAGCGTTGGERPVAGPAPAFARPLDIYRELGFLTGPGQFPVVAGFSTLAGPGDSTLVLVGLSIPNSALRFQREPRGFAAEYEVAIEILDADSMPVRRITTRDTVRIPAFAETGRTDESIIFQRAISLQPGRYLLHLRASDVNSAREFRASEALFVPAYGAAGGVILAPPLVAYRAQGRISRDASPALILNPRNTVSYGADTTLVYVEAYGGQHSVTVQVAARDGGVVWSESALLEGGDGGIRYAVVAIPSETFPLGYLQLRASTSEHVSQVRPLVLTISDQWMVANFEDVLHFLALIAHQEEIDSLQAGSPAMRRQLWDRFWERRNPLPGTDMNEFRDRFFQRVRFAAEAFREPGRAGWQTDRGQAYIVFGAPDHAVERYLGQTDVTGRPNAFEWVYLNAAGDRLNLLFHDRTGFGRFDLIPASAAAFRAAAARAKPGRSGG
jgi:GWxTD domain-containing protein